MYSFVRREEFNLIAKRTKSASANIKQVTFRTNNIISTRTLAKRSAPSQLFPVKLYIRI